MSAMKANWTYSPDDHTNLCHRGVTRGCPGRHPRMVTEEAYQRERAEALSEVQIVQPKGWSPDRMPAWRERSAPARVDPRRTW